MKSPVQPSLYGLVAEFVEPKDLLAAVNEARNASYSHMDAYTPYPVEGLAEKLGMRSNAVPLITLLCGIAGGTIAYGMQYYSAVIDYPLNVGGRPLHSWPAFVPILFELTILGAAIGAVFSMIFLNGLPRLHHPIFETPFFTARNASRFYLCIEACDPQFDESKTRALLEKQSPAIIWEVRS
ncbi:MAG: DUF3341 domain-containing protein [Verrucomicrobia bacterium]|nr:DUF3341 domain-containing protein [Verrucomicrobiota bacterium]